MTWRLDPIVIAVAVALATAFIFGGALWLWWWLPKWQLNHLKLTIYDPKAWADVEDNFRKTIGQLIGGVVVLLGGTAALVGAGVGYLNFQLQFQQQQRQLSEQQQASRELLVSNQVSRGFEQLGNAKLAAIYALEGVMNISERYHRPVLAALSAFIRDGTKTETGDGPPAADIQAALTVIGRRAAIGTGSPVLTGAHIPKADLSNADLSNAELSSADLRSADLRNANLSRANLTGAHLEVAYLKGANLTGAILTLANLGGADLNGASLGDAYLNRAYLGGANLIGAKLSDAQLDGTQLNRADLTGAIDLSQIQMDQACGTDVKLNPGLTIKPCP